VKTCNSINISLPVQTCISSYLKILFCVIRFKDKKVLTLYADTWDNVKLAQVVLLSPDDYDEKSDSESESEPEQSASAEAAQASASAETKGDAKYKGKSFLKKIVPSLSEMSTVDLVHIISSFIEYEYPCFSTYEQFMSQLLERHKQGVLGDRDEVLVWYCCKHVLNFRGNCKNFVPSATELIDLMAHLSPHIPVEPAGEQICLLPRKPEPLSPETKEKLQNILTFEITN
jgi:hypothetical protein